MNIHLADLVGLVTSLVKNNWLPPILVLLILVGMQLMEKMGNIARRIFVGSVVIIILVFSIRTIKTIHALITDPPVWDFQDYWLDAHVAAAGLNFYVPQNYKDQANALNLHFGEDFTQEILDNGFKYPPMTMLFLLPLAPFEVHSAALLWYILQSLFMIIDIFLLWRIFLKGAGLYGLLLISAIFLMFRPVANNIFNGQTNFLSLLMFILFWRDRTFMRAGIWLALGIIVKPFLAVLLLYLLVMRRWQAIASTIVTLVVTSLVSIVAFGSATFLGFFASSPMSKVPSWYFSELGNGSLFAILWRLTNKFFGAGSLGLVQPVFLGIALILVVVTIWVAYRLFPIYDVWILSLVLALGLLIYPNTGTDYCVVIVAPILLVWINRRLLPWYPWGAPLFIVLETALFAFNEGLSNFVFVAIALNWVVFLGFGAFLLSKKHDKYLASA